ncbi:CoA-binding protein, partial [Roseomonas terrae]
PARSGPAPALPRGALTEGEAKRLLAAYGIPVTREESAATADDAVAAAKRIGFPVVLKGVSRAVVHKSDLGLVRLNLRDEAAVRGAFAEVAAALDRAAPGSGEGCVIQELARGEAELFLGATHDPQFGPMVLAGAGGVLVEFLKDVATAPAPLSLADARALIAGLRVAPLLGGLRGRPAADIDAAADALMRLSWLAADLGPRLAELDINPLILRAAGQGAIAVDARATLTEETTP